MRERSIEEMDRWDDRRGDRSPPPDKSARDETQAVAWTRPIPGLRLVRRGAAAVRRIQVYGQRCSGTHAVIRLIEANFGRDAFTEAFGFKHWFVPEQMLIPPDTLVLVIARDPFEWARALHRQPWHVHPGIRDRPFGEFVRAEWHSVWDEEFWGIDAGHPLHGREMLHERDPQTGARFANPIAKRTAKLRHWAAMSRRAHNVALLDYRVVRERPDELVAAISRETGLAAAEPFVPVTSYKGHGLKAFVPTTYPPLSLADRNHVARWLDPAVERLFGFSAE